MYNKSGICQSSTFESTSKLPGVYYASNRKEKISLEEK